MRFIAALDTTIYGRAYAQGAPVDVSTWKRPQLLQFLNNGIISPADITTESLNDALGDASLGQLGDVDLTGLAIGDSLVWDGDSWVVAGPGDTAAAVYDQAAPGLHTPNGTYQPVAGFTLPAGTYTLSAQVSHDGDHSMDLRIFRGASVAYPPGATASVAGATREPPGLTSVWEWSAGPLLVSGGADIELMWSAADGTGNVSLISGNLLATPL